MEESRLGYEPKSDDLLSACKEALAFVLRAVDADYRAEGFDPAEHVTAKRLMAAIARAEAQTVRQREPAMWPSRNPLSECMVSSAPAFAK